MAAEALAPADLCVQALTQPRSVLAGWDRSRWGLLMRQARSAGLLARIGEPLSAEAAELPPWPPEFSAHLDSARRVVAAQRNEVLRELGYIQQALGGLGMPVVVLKGAAYLAAGLAASVGRMFSDVDIMVPRAALGQAESSLMLHGWMGTHHDPYDERYYREWMHELPPLMHMQRRTTLDLHHNIFPLTGRLRPDADALIEASVPLPGYPGLRMLAPIDMLLHSMTHLFMNDDMSHALRDLSDMDLLLRHFTATERDFWDRLIARAAQQGLGRPLFYGLRHCTRVLHTPVPAAAQAAAGRFAPPSPTFEVMDALWRQALTSPHPSAGPRTRAFGLLALYIRGHWLRMPPALLMRHLTIKTYRKLGPKVADTPTSGRVERP